MSHMCTHYKATWEPLGATVDRLLPVRLRPLTGLTAAGLAIVVRLTLARSVGQRRDGRGKPPQSELSRHDSGCHILVGSGF